MTSVSGSAPASSTVGAGTVARSGWWEEHRSELDGLPDGGLNLAHEAVVRHARSSLADTTAVRWIGRRGETRDLSYADLHDEIGRFAAVLARLGCPTGSVVATLAGRIPEVHITALGTMAAGCVYSPLFAAFGPEPIRQRLALGGARAIVTTASLFRRKLVPVWDQLPDLEHVLLVDTDADDADDPRVRSLPALMADVTPRPDVAPTDPETPALVHFTSGTTGTPKGALHVHEAVVAHFATGRDVLDLRPGDVYWCTADPGWVTGTSYGISAPLTNGVTSLLDEGEFDAERWYGLLADQRVTVWYTAPTAIRMMMRAGRELVDRFDLSSLRLMASVGEPLDPDAVRWAQDAFAVPVLDTWWQTETGAMMITNDLRHDVQPGSMGRPRPGIEATILARDPEGNLVLNERGAVVLAGDGEVGELALRAGWPSMFRTYLGMEERYRACFVDGWYRSGDLARRDAAGRYWFVGRGDDVIKTAGHLIGPFEVESVLVEHPAVAHAGVIGLPDETAGQVIAAYVVLASGYEDTPDVRRVIHAHARRALGPAVSPRKIEVRDELPMTRSGKIMRRVLRARELGLPEGDLSTLETGA